MLRPHSRITPIRIVRTVSHLSNSLTLLLNCSLALPAFPNGNGSDSHYSLDAGAYMINALSGNRTHIPHTTISESPESQNLFAGLAPSRMSLPQADGSQLLPAPTGPTQDMAPVLNRSNVFSPHSEVSSGTHPNAGGDGSSDARQAGPSQWRHSPHSNRLPRPSERFYTSLKPPELEIEDVTDWSTVTFFTSLYLKYNHALSPIVHKPTFAHDLATRRDKTDRQFRSLLLGLSERQSAPWWHS